MARLARAVFPGHPHHVTQRGNGRATTFFCDEDYALYRDLLGEHARAAGVEIWAWVLMPNVIEGFTYQEIVEEALHILRGSF